jgi:hypothetical protein
LILFSCEPGRAENGDLLFGLNQNPNTDIPENPSRLLKTMFSHSKNEDTGEWEDTNYIFNYNGNKLVSYTDETGELTKIDYNSNNKISKVYNTGLSSVYEYSGSNVSKVTTNIAGGFGNIVATYSYTGNKLSKIISIQEYTFPIPFKLYMETTYEYQGENIVKSVVKEGLYNPTTGDLEMSDGQQTISSTYDNKKSPFTLLPKEFILMLIGLGPHGAGFLSANNFKSITTLDSTSPPATTTNYIYTYDDKDYPIKVNSDTSEEFTLFTYQ